MRPPPRIARLGLWLACAGCGGSHNPDANNVGTAHGFDGGTGGNKIDDVYIPPQQEVVNAYISHFNADGRYPSDHSPVIGVVKLAAKE